MSVFSYAGKALKMTNPIDATKEIFRAGAESVRMAIESPTRWISDPTNVVHNVLMDVEQISKTVPYMNQTMTDDDIPLNNNLTPMFNQSAYAEYQKEQAAKDAAMARHMAEVREELSKSAADASASAGRRSAAQAAYDAGIKAAQEAAYNSGFVDQETANSVVQNANEIAVTYPDGTAEIIEDAQNASMVPYTNQRSGLNVTALLVYGLIGYGVYKLITGNKKKGD